MNNQLLVWLVINIVTAVGCWFLLAVVGGRFYADRIVLPPRAKVWAIAFRLIMYIGVLPITLAHVVLAESSGKRAITITVLIIAVVWGLVLRQAAALLQRWADPTWERPVFKKH